jgi:hypothetical protein
MTRAVEIVFGCLQDVIKHGLAHSSQLSATSIVTDATRVRQCTVGITRRC